MKAVTIRQPFAWAIAAGFKDIENRGWAPRVEPGELIAVHAAVALTRTTCSAYRS